MYPSWVCQVKMSPSWIDVWDTEHVSKACFHIEEPEESGTNQAVPNQSPHVSTNAGLSFGLFRDPEVCAKGTERLHPWKLRWHWKIHLFHRKCIDSNGGVSIVMLVFRGVEFWIELKASTGSHHSINSQKDMILYYGLPSQQLNASCNPALLSTALLEFAWISYQFWQAWLSHSNRLTAAQAAGKRFGFRSVPWTDIDHGVGTSVYIQWRCWWFRNPKTTTWGVQNPVNDGINYHPQLVSRISEPSAVLVG